ncbi:MAG: threonine synthase [Chloroflexi bacterium]|nr:threonine synthase [Chloroflexota bacterium]
MSTWPGVIEQYRNLIDLPSGAPVVTLLEGNTPLIPAPRLTEEIGAASILIKFEGLNPTGSFKDRGMAVAISEALYRGANAVICASTGNTAASAAAYAARSGLKCFVVIPAGKVAAGKLAGALAYGAETILINGSFDDALRLVTELSAHKPLALVNSINAYRLQGQKTAAFEICDSLGNSPDWLTLPVGNAGNITSYWMGFREYADLKDTGTPRILGVQASGAAPLVTGSTISDPETIATAIRIGNPARGEQAKLAVQQSNGMIVAVSDEEILAAQRQLSGEGLWVEPASAASVAGLRSLARRGDFDFRGQTIVCVCTGHGLKDPEIITDHYHPDPPIPARLSDLERRIEY